MSGGGSGFAGPCARDRPRGPAARRAHEPPRPPGRFVAGEVPARPAAGGRGGLRQPRPGLPRRPAAYWVLELSPAYAGGTLESDGNYQKFQECLELHFATLEQQRASLANKGAHRHRLGAAAGRAGAADAEQDPGRGAQSCPAAGDRQAPPDRRDVRGRRLRGHLAEDQPAHRRPQPHQGLRRPDALRRARPGRLPRRPARPARPQRLWQDDAAVDAGRLAPDAGTVKEAHDLKTVYFTQAREALDPTHSLRERSARRATP